MKMEISKSPKLIVRFTETFCLSTDLAVTLDSYANMFTNSPIFESPMAIHHFFASFAISNPDKLTRYQELAPLVLSDRNFWRGKINRFEL